MPALELKIPPPLVTFLIGIAMWAVADMGPQLGLPQTLRWASALVIAVSGAAVTFAGILEFRRARTTVNPLNPEAASTLVTGGIYRVTRNPMYVGLALVLVAWAVYLSAALPFLGLPLFVLYISVFQILPEERAITIRFGADFIQYTRRVRRWL